MSKIVFINPSTVTYWNSKVMNILNYPQTADAPNLPAMALAALTPEKYSFTYVDEVIDEVDYTVEADLIVIMAKIQTAVRAYEIAGEFRKRGKTVIIGGGHCAVAREEVSRHCDCVMVGEGENLWPAILEDFENGGLKKVYSPEEYPCAEKLISPNIHIINFKYYDSFPIQATLGCPYDCEFCAAEHSGGRIYKTKPVEQVAAEILEYEKLNQNDFKADKKSYRFVDSNLYVNRTYLKELLTMLKPLGIKWEGQGTVNIADDEEILRLMAESGCRGFSIGIESIRPESLAEVNKVKTNQVDQYETCIRNLSKVGVIPRGFFIFGFDSDDVTVFQEAFSFIERSGLIDVVSNILTPCPGTGLYDRLKHRMFNFNYKFNYKDDNFWSIVFTPKKMSADDLMLGHWWLGAKILDLDFIWAQLKKHWNYGPWENIPQLTLRERIALVKAAARLGRHRMYKSQKFALRAAFYPKTSDFKRIIRHIRVSELTSIIPPVKNPAL
ncbi:MAG: B12-binding domain-containing radical SAM protein [Clostridiales bacterium]|jgi:radical SAM superfamily enzyme YgiQ (UPF0313 family)|nr:B12-binding domain-containing radical SAM protein [Clostridiales bacterium]